MSRERDMSRRTFLVGAAAALAAVIAACSSKDDSSGVPGPAAQSRARPQPDAAHGPPSKRADASLLALFEDPTAVVAVGRALATEPGVLSVPDAVSLLEPLGLATTDIGRYGVSEPEAFAAAVDAQAAADVAVGHTRLAGGFLLSDTHAAVAVLVA